MSQETILRYLDLVNRVSGQKMQASLMGLLMLCAGGWAWAEPTRLERVLNNKELRACIWPEYYSITYRNPKTRELSGIDIAITQELAKELGVVIIASLFEKRAEGLYHNTTAVLDADGTYLGKYRKMHIPDEIGRAHV